MRGLAVPKVQNFYSIPGYALGLGAQLTIVLEQLRFFLEYETETWSLITVYKRTVQKVLEFDSPQGTDYTGDLEAPVSSVVELLLRYLKYGFEIWVSENTI